MTGRGPVETFLRGQARRQAGALLVAALAGAAAAGAATWLLGLSGWFLASASIAGAAGSLAAAGFNYLLPSAGFRAFAITRTAGRYLERLSGHAAALRALAALRPALFSAIAAAPPERSLSLSAGEASARLVQDVDAAETEFVRRSAPWAAAAAIASAAALVALASPLAAGALIAGVGVQLALAPSLARRWTTAPAARSLAAAGELKSALTAYLAAVDELQAFDLSDRAVAALMERDEALVQAHVDRADAGARLGLATALVAAAAVAVVAALCVRAATPLAALADLAALTAFEGAAGLLIAAEQRGAHHAALARLNAVAVSAPQPGAPLPGTGPIVLDGMRLEPGAVVALTGPSGAGKTRTLEILVGLRPAPPGRCRIGDIPLEAAPVGAARGLFAYAPQDARLLTGTVADNLRLGAPDASEADLWAALEDAQIAARVRRLPVGLDTWLGQAGEALSGGERRRLSLARAFLRRAPWLLLDEPTEGLDAVAEAALIEALGRRLERTGQGALIVSHRPAPLRLCAASLDVSGSA